jgi:hypothetical protein
MIKITAGCNELLYNGIMPMSGRDVERRPISRTLLKINVTAGSNELFRDGSMPTTGSDMEG